MELTIPHAQMLLCRERDGFETCTKYTDTLLIIWSGVRLNGPQGYYLGDGSPGLRAEQGMVLGMGYGVEHDEIYVDI